MQLLICAHASLPYHPRCGSVMKEEEGEQAAMEPANERCVRRTKHAHAMEEKKVSEHTGAVQGVRVQLATGSFKRSRSEAGERRGTAKT